MTAIPPLNSLVPKPATPAQQLELDFFCYVLRILKGNGFTVTPLQAARATGWSRRTIYDLIKSGALLHHTLPGREKEAKRILLVSLLGLLIKTAQYKAADLLPMLDDIYRALGPSMLLQAAKRAQEEVRRRGL